MWANLGLIFGRARDVATIMAATTFTNLATLGRANAFAPTDLNVRILRSRLLSAIPAVDRPNRPSVLSFVAGATKTAPRGAISAVDRREPPKDGGSRGSPG